MLTRFGCFILTLFLGIAPLSTADFRVLATKAMKASVLIRAKGIRADGKKIFIGCSGTYVSPTHILTAAHCFDQYQPSTIWARGQENVIGYPVRLIKQSKALDLALLEATYPHYFARIGYDTHVGDDILNIGSPLWFEFVASQGIVAATNLKADGFTGRYIMSTAMINHGSSGGGAFNCRGQLIGVNTLSVGMFGWEGISLAVDAHTIRAFLADIN